MSHQSYRVIERVGCTTEDHMTRSKPKLFVVAIVTLLSLTLVLAIVEYSVPVCSALTHVEVQVYEYDS